MVMMMMMMMIIIIIIVIILIINQNNKIEEGPLGNSIMDVINIKSDKNDVRFYIKLYVRK
jgi:hypothetical protein